MKNSKLFKRSLLLLAVVALAVVLTVGIVAGAATISEGNADYGEVYAGVNVSVKGQVALRFYFETLGTAEEFVAEITDPAGNTTSKTYPVDSINKVTVGSGEQAQELYRVSVSLAPSQMAYSVKLYANGASGAGKAYVYSVKEYAEDVIADPDLTDDHDAMRALLNWGAMAQIKFGDSVDSLANDGIFARNTNPASSVKDIADQTINGVSSTDEAVFPTANKEVSLNVYLTNTDVAMGFIFPYKGDGKLTADIYKNGNLVKEDDAVVAEADGLWRANIRDLTATCYDDVYKVVVSDGTNSMTAEYSILAYVDYVIADGATASDGSLIGEDQKNVCRAMYQFYQNVAEGAINTKCAHGASTYWIDNGNNTHSYKCAECFKQISNVNVPVSATTYYTAFDIDQPQTSTNPYHPKSVFRVKTTADYSGAFEYTRIEGTETTPAASQLLWQRVAEDLVYTQSTGNQQRYSVDVGNAQYLVLKARTNTPDLVVSLAISTTGKNGDTGIATEDTVSGDGKKVNINNETLGVGDTYVKSSGYSSIMLPLNAVKADEWGTYVIDLAEVVPEYYVKEGDSYKVDTFYLHFSSFGVGQTMDVAYMAFVEDDVVAFTGESTYIKIANVSGVGALFDSTTGKCVGDCTSFVEKTVDNVYTVSCVVCGEVHREVDLDGIDFFDATDIKNANVHYNMKPDDRSAAVQFNGPSSFVHYAGKGGTAQIIFNRSAKAGGYQNGSAIEIGAAKYVMLKMKASNRDLISGIRLSTTESNSVANVYFQANTEWTTYIFPIELFSSKVTPKADGTITLTDFYFNFADANSATVFTVNDYFEMSYVAFCETWDDVVDMADTETARLVVSGGSTGVGAEYGNINVETRKCVDAHNYTMDTTSGYYTAKCSICDYVQEYDVSTSDANAFWPAEQLFFKAMNPHTSGAQGAYLTGEYESVTIEKENGENYLHLYNATSNKAASGAWHGWNLLNGASANTGRYMIVKLRIGNYSASSFTMYMASKHLNTGSNWVNGGVTVALDNAAQWQTIVIDLESRVADNTFAADPDTGKYLLGFLQIRPFGGGNVCDNTTNEYFDISYVAFCDELSDVSGIVKEDTFGYSKSASSNVTFDTKTAICVNHDFVYATDETDERGYHYECSTCGNVFAMDYYSSGNGGKYGDATVSVQTDEAGFKYVSYLATAGGSTGGAFFDYHTTTGGGGGVSSNPIHAGRYLVVKLRGNTTADVPFYVGANDIPNDKAHNNNYSGGYIGALTAETMPAEWTVAVIDLTSIPDYYYLGDYQKFFFSSTNKGGSLTKPGAQVDIAYTMVVNDFADIAGLTEGETVKFYFNSFAKTPIDMDDLCDGTKHTYYSTTTTENGTTVYTGTCYVCGDKKVQTVSADINYFSSLDYMGCYSGTTITRYQYDYEENVHYNSFTANASTHWNISGNKVGGNGGAGDFTSSTYDSGEYVVIKYRPTGTTKTTMTLYLSNDGKTTNTAANNVGTITANAGDGWKVAVVKIADKSLYTINTDSKLYFMISPGGDKAMDIAYLAVVDSLEEAASLLQDGEKYYYHGTSFGNAATVHNKDGSCVECSFVYTVDESAENGYKYVCSLCGKVSNINFFTQTGGHWNNGTVTTMLDPEGFSYNRYASTGTSYYDLATKNSWNHAADYTANKVMTGRYLAIKMRGTLDGNLTFKIGTKDKYDGVWNPITSSVGVLNATTMPSEWTVMIIDLQGLQNYTLGEMQEISFHTSETGAGKTIDVAYVVIGDSIEELKEFINDETYAVYGNSLTNTPTVKNTADDSVVTE